MSVQRYDIEWAAASGFALYLQSKIDAALQVASPVVTIFDPMAVDEANRFVVEIPKAQTMNEEMGNFNATCKCTVKSRWARVTVQGDLNAHFNRSNWLRDALMADSLVADLATLLIAGGGGLVIDFIQPKKNMETVVQENGFIYSHFTFDFNGYFSTT